MQEKIDHLEKEFLEALKKTDDVLHLEQVKVHFLGKKGALTALLKGLKDMTPEERTKAGMKANQLKTRMQEQLDLRREELKKAAFDQQVDQEWIDITLDQEKAYFGSQNPISLVQNRLEDIFISMGFQILDGPHVETEHYNFEALNIPAHHPARDLQDTFYLESGHLLRTQTSTIQIRGMEKLKPPFRIIGPGKVFRCERTDASHDSCFHQIEGMFVDKDISVAHLIYFMKTMLSEVFETEINVRLRPGYFPFVEPGFELEINCILCQGKGCSVCKQVGWLELLGCGMVHPNVLRSGNIDPDQYSGFAFGMGLDRLAMMRYGIHDIRYFHSSDLKFLRQFSS